MLRNTHPAVLVTAGCFFILWIQFISPFALLSFSAFLILLASFFSWQTYWRIFKRLRFIFLALLVLFAWQTPGQLIFPAFGQFSPSYEGLELAALQAARLLGCISIVALLMDKLSPLDWVNGLYGLSRPFKSFCFSPDRFAIRVFLIFNFMQQQNHSSPKLMQSWRSLLNDADLAPRDLPAYEPVVLKKIDKVCIAAMWGFAILVGWVLWQG